MAQTQKAAETKQEVQTIIPKDVAPVLLAFLSGWYDNICFQQYKIYSLMPTGSTVNMCIQIGNKDFSNVKFLGSAVANYSLGMFLYKFLDMRGATITTGSKVMLFLHTVGDQLRLLFPDNRMTVMPFSIAGGYFNSLAAGKLGGIMAMMNGQYQGFTAAIAMGQQDKVYQAIKVIAAFCFGIMGGSYTKNMASPLTGNRKFTVIGILYALILVLRDTPRR